MSRAVSILTATTLMLVIVAVSVLLLYAWLSHGVAGQAAGASGSRLGGAVKVEAAVSGPGYLVIYGRCVLAPCIVDTVYLRGAGGLVEAYTLPTPIRAAPGERLVIPVALSTTGSVVSVTLSGPNLAPSHVVLRGVDSTSAAALIGLLASRGGYEDPRDANPEKIHWLYLSVIDGSYRFRYINRGTVRDAEGRAPLFASTNRLDLCNMTKSEREQLGPVVVFLNPYRAASDYTVTIVPANCGRERRITLPRLVGNEEKVALDALILWEDQWWPGTTRVINNYLNHVVRVTLFTNATIRVEVIQVAGPALHMFLYRPAGLPPFNEIPSIVEKYMDEDYVGKYMLREGDGVVYVKARGARVPPLEEGDIWDPVHGTWVSTWPVVFTVGP